MYYFVYWISDVPFLLQVKQQFSWKPDKRLSSETGCKRDCGQICSITKKKKKYTGEQEVPKVPRGVKTECKSRERPQCTTIHSALGCRNRSFRSFHEMSPPHQLIIQHFTVRYRKPGHWAARKLDRVTLLSEKASLFDTLWRVSRRPLDTTTYPEISAAVRRLPPSYLIKPRCTQTSNKSTIHTF